MGTKTARPESTGSDYAGPRLLCLSCIYLLSKVLTGRLGAFLKRCYRYGFASETEHVDNSLFDNACNTNA